MNEFVIDLDLEMPQVFDKVLNRQAYRFGKQLPLFLRHGSNK